MALVLLPCDMPWWPTLERDLEKIGTARTTEQMTDAMLKVHSMCNVGLDPDEPEEPDETVLDGFRQYLEKLDSEERDHILKKTIPSMVKRALKLKQLKPPAGYHFCLQQQASSVDFDREFVASIVAHCFFSTFPKRTPKTHPTLQDCNFSMFFKHLNKKSQQVKLKSILHYFDVMDTSDAPKDKIVISRQVMTGREWLTIEDWMECGLPLCSVVARHQRKIEQAEPTALQVCFATSRLGGPVLDEGSSMESVQFVTCPELLVLLLSVESLEDNEAVMVENVIRVAQITHPRHSAQFSPLTQPPLVTICCVDADNYLRLPLSQFEEDNILRELNKALLGFRQGTWSRVSLSERERERDRDRERAQDREHYRRLSPIGESFGSNLSEGNSTVLYSRPKPPPQSNRNSKAIRQRRSASRERSMSPLTRFNGGGNGSSNSVLFRRNRFIMLGSSGECLPVSRRGFLGGSDYSSCNGSESDEYQSAHSSLEGESSSENSEPEEESEVGGRHTTFAQRLRAALNRETASSESVDSASKNPPPKKGTAASRASNCDSRGFILDNQKQTKQDSVESFSASAEFRRAARKNFASKKNSGASSEYSFSSESSGKAAEEEHEPLLLNQPQRDEAIMNFAEGLLKRTLSDSFAGVALNEDGDQALDSASIRASRGRPNMRLALAARSLSLELARHKHRLASQLVSLLCTNLAKGGGNNIRSIATGNWGCGILRGDPQLKFLIQWMASSVAGAPCLLYYTCANEKLVKLDTVCRLLLDRRWTVGNLATTILHLTQNTLENPATYRPVALFETLLLAETPARLDNTSQVSPG